MYRVYDPILGFGPKVEEFETVGPVRLSPSVKLKPSKRPASGVAQLLQIRTSYN